MEARDIKYYLAELGTALQKQGVQKPLKKHSRNPIERSFWDFLET